MKGQWRKSWRVLMILLATAALGLSETNIASQGPTGQQDTMPRPGTVNYIEGQVSVNGESVAPNAVRSTILEPNELISTGQGYAEVLLTRGAFLRIGRDSQLRMLSAGLAEVRVELLHGSAMIEAAQLVKGTSMTLVMDGVTAQIEQKGLYAFDTNQQSVKVLDGKAQVLGTAAKTTLKKDDEVLLSSTKPFKKREFDEKTAKNDPLYVWSRIRSQDEAQANLSAANTIAIYGGWYGPGWYWDPYWDFYAFVPGWGVLGSPFGWGFYSPGYVWAAPYGWRGVYAPRGAFAHGFHGGIGGFHAAGGMHGGMAGGRR
jgi:tellurite resistance protein